MGDRLGDRDGDLDGERDGELVGVTPACRSAIEMTFPEAVGGTVRETDPDPETSCAAMPTALPASMNTFSLNVASFVYVSVVAAYCADVVALFTKNHTRQTAV